MDVRSFRTASAAVILSLSVLLSGCSLEWWARLPTEVKLNAVLLNAPIEVSAAPQLSVSVQGFAVSQYQYKLGLASAMSCSDPTGYSVTMYPAGTPISDSLTPYLEQQVTLCVVAISADGRRQEYSAASSVSWFVDSTLNLLQIAEGEQSAQEVDSTVKVVTVTSTVAKPYDLLVTYKVTGDAVAALDHSLGTTGTVTLPAGQLSVAIPFRVYSNPFSTANKEMLITLQKTNRPKGIVGNFRASRFIIYDTDNSARAVTSVLSNSQTTACAVLSDGVLKCWGANGSGQIGDGTQIPRAAPVVIDSGVSYRIVATGFRSTTCGIVAITGVLKCWGSSSNYELGNGSTVFSTTPIVVDSGTAYKKIYPGNTMCGITSSDVLKCWGLNSSGQVGDGTTVIKTTPTAIGGALRFSSMIPSYSGTTTCAITTTSDLYCWGLNASGQVGDGTLVLKSSPTLITSGTTYASLSTYGANTCAITAVGSALRCWGAGTNGLVGDGTSTTRSSPTTIMSGTAFSMVSVDANHACALTTGGAVYCWGVYVGDGATTTRTSPVAVDVGVSYASIQTLVPDATCGIVATTGALKCWGQNYASILGDGTSTRRNVPTLIDAGVGYRQVTGYFNSGSSYSSTCGLTLSNHVKCWGNNFLGQVGDGSSVNRFSPVAADDAGAVYSTLSVGNYSRCAVTSGGVLKCWGRNDSYQLGIGLTLTRASPVVVDEGTSYLDVDAWASCGITTSRALKCWGANNASGILGNGTTTAATTPIVIDAGTTYSKVSGDLGTNCGLTTAGVLKCWGNNGLGQVGNGTTLAAMLPTVVDSGTLYSSFWIANGTVCGITTGKVLKCWGSNNTGQVGVGSTSNILSPTVVDGGAPYKTVWSDSGATCAITDAGAMKCWGYNTYGQLGTGNNTQYTLPQAIDASTVYAKVFMGTWATCGITNTGALKCWGFNNSGLLGNGGTSNTNAPAVINAGTSYIAASIAYGMCAVTASGVAQCTGDNSWGQIGDGTNISNRTVLTNIADGDTFTTIAKGVNGSCALSTSGVSKCWGQNDWGQTGEGTELYRPIPRDITKWLTP